MAFNNDPQLAVCKLLEHFGIEWQTLSSATIEVDGSYPRCVTIKTTREIHNDCQPLAALDNKTYKITVNDN